MVARNHRCGDSACHLVADRSAGALQHRRELHALFKRAYVGVFHSISGKHMDRYLREVEFHWSNRGSLKGRLTTLFATKAGPLPLKLLFAFFGARSSVLPDLTAEAVGILAISERA
jgi:hypothetical protein